MTDLSINLRAMHEMMLDREMVYICSHCSHFLLLKQTLKLSLVVGIFSPCSECPNLHWRKFWQRLMSCQYYDGAFSLLLKVDHSWCKLMLLVAPWKLTDYVIITLNSQRRCLQLVFSSFCGFSRCFMFGCCFWMSFCGHSELSGASHRTK